MLNFALFQELIFNQRGFFFGIAQWEFLIIKVVFSTGPKMHFYSILWATKYDSFDSAKKMSYICLLFNA